MGLLATQRLDIGPHSYVVEEYDHDGWLEALQREDAEQVLGWCNRDLLIIRLRAEQRPGQPLAWSKRQEVLAHEITHAIYGLAVVEAEPPPEETLVTTLAARWLEALVRNPWLAVVLTAPPPASPQQALLRAA